MRRTWRTDAKAWAQPEQLAQARWNDMGGPVLAGIDDDIAALEHHVDHPVGGRARTTHTPSRTRRRASTR